MGMKTILSFFNKIRWPLALFTLVLIGGVTALAPLERTLGANVRLVYLHGAWVWTGKVAFALAALAGLGGLLLRRSPWPESSLALGRAGLVFWLTYLPMSLLVQQLNWGGIFWDEPRWRVPFAFGVAAVLVQVALVLFNTPLLSCAANLGFGMALWVGLGNVQNVLHPDSPIFGSGAVTIEVFFVVLLGLVLFLGLQMAAYFYQLALPGSSVRSGS